MPMFSGGPNRRRKLRRHCPPSHPLPCRAPPRPPRQPRRPQPPHAHGSAPRRRPPEPAHDFGNAGTPWAPPRTQPPLAPGCRQPARPPKAARPCRPLCRRRPASLSPGPTKASRWCSTRSPSPARAVLVIGSMEPAKHIARTAIDMSIEHDSSAAFDVVIPRAIDLVLRRAAHLVSIRADTGRRPLHRAPRAVAPPGPAQRARAIGDRAGSRRSRSRRWPPCCACPSPTSKPASTTGTPASTPTMIDPRA